MITDELRQSFLDFFKSKGHKVVESSSLVPHNDPTILFTNAGMNQFKHVFTGEEKVSFKTATSCQKCMRAGGKHNDLENVGYTARHHTFFEMMGNFSFGDYFKTDAIKHAWEFVTRHLKFSEDKLWVSVYKNDKDALKIWRDDIGFPEKKIMKFGEKDNFWAMGETGPCGPCSEIFYDIGEILGRTDKKANPETDEERFIEFWNLVFMEFVRDESGKMEKLPKPSIDTGLGLERVSAIKHGVVSNYGIDIFKPLLAHLGELSANNFENVAEDKRVSMRAISDHARACTFLIAEGIVPSNEGRGYVLRRIVRRALRHGHLLGLDDPFLYKLVPDVIETMSGFYTELKDQKESVTVIIKNEEKSFLETLSKGMQIVDAEAKKISSKTSGPKRFLFPGLKAFDLYQTYGFPLDLTQDALKKYGLKVDITGFEQASLAHREKAKGTFTLDKNKPQIKMEAFQGLPITKFTGDSKSNLKGKGKILKILILNEKAKEIAVALDKSSFYAESGGQIGDKGILKSKNYSIEIKNTFKSPGSVHIHHGKVKEGKISDVKTGEIVETIVSDSRLSAMRNHTATHLLHRALQDNLGKHVKQSGSLVEPQRLRFDFSHPNSIAQDVLRKIENDVNKKILENITLQKETMPLDKARKKGAMALFGEKYGENVRVVEVPGYSLELCGGTHVERTGDIGLFKIISESSIASGIRRIEALTGVNALIEFRKSEDIITDIAGILKTEPSEIVSRIQKNLKRIKELEKKIESGDVVNKKEKSEELLNSARKVNDFKLLSAETPADNPKALREMADLMLDKLQKGIVVLGTKSGSKVFITAKVSKDLTSKYSAKTLIQSISKIIGGGGGGKPDIAEAGGSKPDKLKEALDKIYDLVQ